MGRAADAIAKQADTIKGLTADKATLLAENAALRAQPIEDASDVTAIDSVLGPVVPAGTNALSGATSPGNASSGALA